MFRVILNSDKIRHFHAARFFRFSEELTTQRSNRRLTIEIAILVQQVFHKNPGY